MNIKIERFGLPYNPQKERRKRKRIIRQILLFVFFYVILAAALAVGVAIVIGKTIIGWSISDTIDSIWIGSLASYWGGIVGGILSGVLALFGVYFTIKYYKEADEEKEKAAIQPFLMVTKREDNKPCRGYRIRKYGSDRAEQGIEEKKKQEKANLKRVDVYLENIGNGFATTLVIHTGFNLGGFEYNKVLPVNVKEPLMLMCAPDELSEGVEFDIQYIDSMRNEYVQRYQLKEEYGTVQIDCGYPQFLEQN